MNLDSALQGHIDWKIKFHNAISKQRNMDAEAMSKDNCCELGKWLHEEGKTKYSSLPTYTAALTKHAEFHVEAGKIACAINAKKYAEAEAMLDFGSPFATASKEVGIAIMHLKIEASII